jgi:CBS domain-containing protein
MAFTYVKDVMTKNVISIDSSMTVKDAAAMMEDTNVGSIVITDGNTPVGILTERDFVNRVVGKDKASDTPLSEVMTQPITVVEPDETVWNVAEVMRTKNIHKVPVQDGNKLVGIFTATDLVRICSYGSDSQMRKITEQILIRLKNTPKQEV